jgi:3-oxoacyl-[acyl-carrier-protein] synthase-3
MFLNFKKNKIIGILSVVPKKEIVFDDEVSNYNFPPERSLKLKSTMGFNKRRVVENGTTVSDLSIYGLNYLFSEGHLSKDEIDALILVTQTPDYILPPTSNIIQGALGLKQDIICMDINQGCAGYIIGLIQAFSLLGQDSIDKVVLINADVLSQKVSKHDRNSNPLIGDAAAITIIQKSNDTELISFSIKMNGEGAMALQIPAGGAKLPISEVTSILEEDSSGNIRSKNHLVMKGDEVFNFVQKEVPTLIEDLLVRTNITKEQVDYFMFHQPNKFMLNKLADKIGVPREKMPSNIVENFGNSSGATIPIAITHNIGKDLEISKLCICLSGFGVGLTWGAGLMNIGNLKFCKQIEF